jgi:hypothetical protein
MGIDRWVNRQTDRWVGGSLGIGGVDIGVEMGMGEPHQRIRWSSRRQTDRLVRDVQIRSLTITRIAKTETVPAQGHARIDDSSSE